MKKNDKKMARDISRAFETALLRTLSQKTLISRLLAPYIFGCIITLCSLVPVAGYITALLTLIYAVRKSIPVVKELHRRKENKNDTNNRS